MTNLCIDRGPGLTFDCFGRTVVTHACPVCAAHFVGPAVCRGVGDGPGKRAHVEEVKALPIHGCVEPPNRKFLVALPVTIMASTETKAQEMAKSMVEGEFPKRFVERHGWKLSAQAVETMPEANFRRRMEYAAKKERERASLQTRSRANRGDSE